MAYKDYLQKQPIHADYQQDTTGGARDLDRS